jgi:hypothetical protein
MEKCEKGKQNNAFHRIQGDEETAFHFRYSQEQQIRHGDTTRNLKRTFNYKRRAHIALSPSSVGPSDPYLARRHSGSASSPLSLPSSSLIRTSAGCVSYVVGGQGPTEADDECGSRKDDLGFPQHGPRHVTDPTKPIVSSPSRGNSHVVPNARNSSAQMSHCASSIQSFNGWDFGSSIVSCDVFLAGLASTVSHYRWVVVVRASRWWSCGVLRSKWGGPKDSIGTKHGTPEAAGVGTGKQTILRIDIRSI